jgi:TolB-like protein/class 3 adenylate cyclase/DNA-binding SARP family transcriptional activator
MERRLAAILAADIVGYSRLIAADEAGTLSAIAGFRGAAIDPLIARYTGRVVKTMGDGLLVEFPSAVAAIECALAWQDAAESSAGPLRFRIGVNLGEVVVEDGDIYGDAVNVAARLEGDAAAGSVCISADLYRQVAGKITREFEDLGERTLKNIAKPVRVYRAAAGMPAPRPDAEGALQIHTLGRFAVTGPEGPVEIGSKKLRALLAYLAATHPVPQSRETLMALLWGSHFDKQARQNLRQSLTRLKRLLGATRLEIGPDTVAMRAGAADSDIGRLGRAIADPSLAALRRSAEIPSAEFLPGFTIPEEAWTEWLEEQRRRVRRWMADAFTALGRAELDGGDAEAAIRAGERALEIDGLREDAFRLLAGALDRAGRGADAVARYETLVRHLRDELGASPAEETRAVIAALRNAPADAPGAGTGPPEPSAGTGPAAPEVAIPEGPSLAVLPFRNITGDEKAEIIASGLAEDIVTTLAKISSVLVVARTSTLKYQDAEVDRAALSREQGVRHILEGAVRMVGDRVRVTAHLSDALTGREVWADRFDRWFKDFLDIQDEITKEIVSALQVELTDGEQARVWAHGTEDTMAWENVVVATELIHAHHRDGIAKARRLAEQACRLDPEFAAAWAAIGWTHWVEGRWGWANRRQRFDTAWTLAGRALSIDPDNPDALALSGVCALHLGRFEEALQRMEQAMAHAPGHAHIAALTGYVHRYGGDADRTVTCIDRAIRLSPVHPAWYLVVKGAGFWRLGRDGEAVALLREAVRRDPQFAPAFAFCASLLGDIGDTDAARPVVRQLVGLEPDFSSRRWCEINPYRDPADRERELAGLIAAGAPG